MSLSVIDPKNNFAYLHEEDEGLHPQKWSFGDPVAEIHPLQSHYHLDSTGGSEPIETENGEITVI